MLALHYIHRSIIKKLVKQLHTSIEYFTSQQTYRHLCSRRCNNLKNRFGYLLVPFVQAPRPIAEEIKNELNRESINRSRMNKPFFSCLMQVVGL